MKLTPQQKQQKAELLDLAKAKNRALSSLNFGIIKTYEDFLTSLGHGRSTLQAYYPNQSQLAQPATRQDILAFFGSYETELLQRHAGVYDNFTYEFVPHEYEGVYYDGTTSTGAPANIVDSDLIVAGDSTDALEECLPESPKQLCKLFAFQERAAVALLNNIIKKNYLLDVAVACDPAIENCFSAEDAEPYKKVQMLASEAPICLQEHSCEDFKCTAGTSCVITLCSADTLAEGESCTQP